MTTFFREVCPVDGCRGWLGEPREVGVPGDPEGWEATLQGRSLYDHLVLDHPEVDQSQLWSTYETFEPGPISAGRVAVLLGVAALAAVVGAVAWRLARSLWP